MKPGSVLVDVAIDQGGCFEGSRPTTHADPTSPCTTPSTYCVANMPGAVPNTSTWGLTNAFVPYAVRLADSGWRGRARGRSGARQGSGTTHDGQITCPGVAAAFDLPARTSPTSWRDARRRHRAGDRRLAGPPRGRAGVTIRWRHRRCAGPIAARGSTISHGSMRQRSPIPRRPGRHWGRRALGLAATSAGRTLVAVRPSTAFALTGVRVRSGSPRGVLQTAARSPCAAADQVGRHLDAAGVGRRLCSDRALLEVLGLGARVSRRPGWISTTSCQVPASSGAARRGGRNDWCPWLPYAGAALDAYLDPGPPYPRGRRPQRPPALFSSITAGAPDPARRLGILKAAADRAGGPWSHRIRFGTPSPPLAAGRADVRIVQELLGPRR